METKKNHLPFCFPFREQLFEQGFNTVNQLNKCKDLTELKGIGRISANYIKEYICIYNTVDKIVNPIEIIILNNYFEN